MLNGTKVTIPAGRLSLICKFWLSLPEAEYRCCLILDEFKASTRPHDKIMVPMVLTEGNYWLHRNRLYCTVCWSTFASSSFSLWQLPCPPPLPRPLAPLCSHMASGRRALCKLGIWISGSLRKIAISILGCGLPIASLTLHACASDVTTKSFCK